MLNRNNEHFETLMKTAEAYEAKRAALEEKKQEIIDTCGWESEELKAWYDEKGKLVYPIPQGACKAYRAWKQTVEKEEDEVEMNDFLWDREVTDFLDCLRAAGMKTFIYTNQSTAVMENIHAFEAEGCRLEGLTTITRMERRFGADREEQIPGIRFSL